MANWQDPRPLFPWSPPPDQKIPRTAPKIRPNVYARMARFSVQHPIAMLLLLIFFAATAATIVLLTLRVDFTRQILADTTPTERRSATDLAIRFPDIGSVLRIRLASSDPAATVATIQKLAAELNSQPDVVQNVLLPELRPAASRFAPYYLDTPEFNRRIEGLKSAQAYYQLLAASPTLGGLNGVLATAKGAADAGSVPASLAPLLDALSAAATDIVEGKSASIDWSNATGLSAPPVLPEVSLLVVPQRGKEDLARDMVKKAVEAEQTANASISVQVEAASQEFGSMRMSSTGRQFVVALCLALLFLISLLAMYFRSPRDVVLALLPVGAGVLTALAASTFVETPLDSVSATLPLLLVPGSLVMALCYILALGRHEKRAISTMSLIMLAAQQSGTVAVAMLAVSLLFWLVWLVLGPAGTPALSIGALAGHVAALLTTYLILPTFAALVPRTKPDFVPAAAGEFGRSWPLLKNLAPARPWAAAGVLGAALAGALILLLHDGVAGGGAATRPLHIQVASRDGAASHVDKLRAEENVGRILWVEDFLPSDVEAKRRLLPQLSGIALPVQTNVETPEQVMAEQFQQLDEALRLIAASPGEGMPYKTAATRLRRSLALLSNDTAGPAQAGRKFEQVLSGSMQQLSAYFAQLAALAPPVASDLDPALRSLFLAQDGTYRIEVWPRPPVSERDFISTVHAVDKSAISINVEETGNSFGLPFRFAISLIAVIIGVFGLSLAVLGQTTAAVEALIAQICCLLIFGGAMRLLGAGPPGQIEIAAFAGFILAAMTSLWSKLSLRNAWITKWSAMLGPFAGAAVALPLALLSIHELVGFSQAALLFSAIVVVVQAVLAPQLQVWFAGLDLFKRILRVRTPARNKMPPAGQLSTKGKSDANTISSAEARQPPQPNA